MDAISIARGGMQSAYSQFAQSAARVASAGVQVAADPVTSQPTQGGIVQPRQEVDLAQELVTQRDAQLSYSANAKVIGVGDSMQESTIRMLG